MKSEGQSTNENRIRLSACEAAIIIDALDAHLFKYNEETRTHLGQLRRRLYALKQRLS